MVIMTVISLGHRCKAEDRPLCSDMIHVAAVPNRASFDLGPPALSSSF